MAAPPETTAAPPPDGDEEAQDDVEVCLFDESGDVFSRAVRAISELTAGEPEPDFPDAEVERLASSITFLREWRHFSYEPRDVSFTFNSTSAPSKVETRKIKLPQFSSASVPQLMQSTHLDDGKDNTYSSDSILFAGGNVWALDWCPRLCDRPYSPVNCEYLAVGAHPPGSSYHKIGAPLIGRGIIQVWCLLTPFEEAHPHQPMVISKAPKPRGRPRKTAIPTPDDHSEPSAKRPRGRPRKYPEPIANVEDSSKKSKSQDLGIIDPLVSSAAVSCNPAVASAMPTVKFVEATPRKGRGRPRKKPIEEKGLSGHEINDLSTALSPIALVCMEPKRKRGRPRKHPAPSNSKHLPGTGIELGKDTVCLHVSADCSLGPTENIGFNANLTSIAVDEPLPVPSSSHAICEKKSTRRGRGHSEKEAIHGTPCCSVVPYVVPQSTDSSETITNDPTVFVENSMPSEQSKIGSMLPTHILAKISNISDSSGTRGRGQRRKKPLSSATSSLFFPGTETPKPVSVLTNRDNLMVLAKNNGEMIANDPGSIGSSRCTIESNAHLSVVTSDAASVAQGLCVAKCKESIAKRGRGRTRKKSISTECGCSTACTWTITHSRGNVEGVEHYRKESCPRKVRWHDKKESASNECSSLALNSEVQKMERSSTIITSSNCLNLIENSVTLGSSINADIPNKAGLIGYKSGTAGCDTIKMCESNASCYTSDCNIENSQADQVVSVPSENSAQVIDELEDTEVTPFKESTKNHNMISCDKKAFSPIPKDISLPRVVLCLAHNGKVAWDIKWKPPLANQSEQKSHLGFLAVLLGNGSLEVWEVPSPSMIQKIYSSSSKEGTDPRFLKLQPVFSCSKVNCGNIQSIPLTVDWSPSHDMILAGCHDGTVALWKFSANLLFQESKPFMCVTAESVPIRTVSWAPYASEENVNIFATAGEDGLKFWDLRDPYRPLWELTTAPRAVLSLQWLKDTRGIIISLEDGTLKFLSLSRIANNVPVIGRPFVGTKTQGVSTYQLSEHLIWSVHASEITGYAAYCVADGTAIFFELTPRFWEKEPGRNRVPYFLSGSLSEEGTTIKISVTLPNSPLSNVPAKRATKTCKDVDQPHVLEDGKLLTNSEYNCAVNLDLRDNQQDGPDEGQETGAIVSAAPSMQENAGTRIRGSESPENFEIFPPKAVALHRLRWNMNKGSERWMCYGGAAGIVRCQRI